jgi:hypothetical protein
MTVSKVLSQYSLDLVGVQKVICEGVAPNQQKNTHFSIETEMKPMKYRRYRFLYIKEPYQQLRVLSLLVIGWHKY